MLLAEQPFSHFLDSPPAWTLDGAVVSLPQGDVTLEQSVLRLTDGVWQCQVSARGAADGEPPHRILLRVAPHTLRRWKEVEINPFLEARAQIREHLTEKDLGAMSLLTLL